MLLLIVLFIVILWIVLIGFSLWHETIPYKTKSYTLKVDQTLSDQDRILSKDISKEDCQRLCDSQQLCKGYTHIPGDCVIYESVNPTTSVGKDYYLKK